MVWRQVIWPALKAVFAEICCNKVSITDLHFGDDLPAALKQARQTEDVSRASTLRFEPKNFQSPNISNIEVGGAPAIRSGEVSLQKGGNPEVKSPLEDQVSRHVVSDVDDLEFSEFTTLTIVECREAIKSSSPRWATRQLLRGLENAY